MVCCRWWLILVRCVLCCCECWFWCIVLMRWKKLLWLCVCRLLLVICVIWVWWWVWWWISVSIGRCRRWFRWELMRVCCFCWVDLVVFLGLKEVIMLSWLFLVVWIIRWWLWWRRFLVWYWWLFFIGMNLMLLLLLMICCMVCWDMFMENWLSRWSGL